MEYIEINKKGVEFVQKMYRLHATFEVSIETAQDICLNSENVWRFNQIPHFDIKSYNTKTGRPVSCNFPDDCWEIYYEEDEV